MYLDEPQQVFGYGEPSGATPAVAAGEPFRAGRYVILQHVGHGAMGNVYAAYDPDLDRKVAVKVLRDGGRPLPASLAREAKAMAKLAHPHVVAVYDVGTCERGVFVAMEFVEGVTLRAWLRAEERPWREVLAAFVLAGRGLAAAHEAGVVHHDFKPDNVLVGAGGAVKVVDFGLARVVLGTAAAVSGELGAQAPSPGEATRGASGGEVSQGGASGRGASTQGGASGSGPSTRSAGSGAPTLASERGPVGTLAYMAPERHAARPADARSDQFSFCVALYEALYRQRPFAGADVAALRQAVLHGAPAEPPRGTPVPARVAAALRRGLARAPEDRFASMAALLAALAEPPRRRLHWTLTAGLLLGATSAMMAARRGEDRCAGVTAEADAWWAARAPGLQARAPDEAARLGRVVAAWRARAADNCEAGQSGRLAPDLRRAREACLDQRLAGLRAHVDRAADDPTGAADLLARVPSTDACDDPAMLTAVAPPRPEAADEVRALRRALAGVAALEVAGEFGEAARALAGLADRVDAVGYAPLAAEVDYQRGRIAHYRGETGRALESLQRAVDGAEAHRHDRLAADAWGFLVEVAALTGHPGLDAWERRARAARARLRAAGDRGALRHLALGGWTPWHTHAGADPQQVHPGLMRGLVHLHAGESAKAEQAFRAALAEPELHPLMRAKLTLNLAVAQGPAGGPTFDAALAAYHHPRIGPAHRAKALIQRAQFHFFYHERYAAARADFAAAAPLLDAEAPGEFADLRAAYRGIAVADVMDFKLAAAASAVAAAERAERLGGLGRDGELAEVAFEVHLLGGRPELARSIAADALAGLPDDAAPAARAQAETRVGEALMWLGEAGPARDRFTAALARLARAGDEPGDDAPAYAHKGLGLLALRAGAPQAAAASLEQALARWQATPCGCRDEAEARLALAIVRRGDPSLRAAADAYFSGLGEEATAYRDRLLAWLERGPTTIERGASP
jgi:serine/threonine protein kinase/tetratricopeptide (TPR) repeat protein